MKGFKDFIFRGNVVDLAIAVVIGAAFSSLVSSFVSSFLTPLIAAIGGQPDFSDLYFTINGSRFLYGQFINALLSFLIVSAVIYYLVVVPLARMTQRGRSQSAPTKRDCPECLSSIPIEARRCAYCTASVTPIRTLRSGS